MGTQHSFTDHTRKQNRSITVGAILIAWTVLLIISCVHEPFPIIEPDPGSNNGNPVDTTGENSGGIACDPDSIYFSRDILPIIQSNCAKSGCHDAVSHEEGIVLDNFQNIMSGGEIRPFNLDKSELYEVITETDPDKIMPPPPNQKLSPEQINLINQWIMQGAKDLTCDESAGMCDTLNISYSKYIAPLLSTHCTGCHSGNNPSGNILLNLHPAVQDLALNGRLLGAISWSSGYEAMPQGLGKLSDCNIEKIKAWINDGAPDN